MYAPPNLVKRAEEVNLLWKQVEAVKTSKGSSAVDCAESLHKSYMKSLKSLTEDAIKFYKNYDTAHCFMEEFTVAD